MLKISVLFLVSLILTAFIPVSVMAGKGDEVSKPYKPLVVQISTDFAKNEEYGFGFIVGETGDFFYIVTANHVVRAKEPGNPTQNVWIRYSWDPGGARKEAELLDSMHAELDIALLRIAKRDIYMANMVSWNEQAYCLEWIDEESVWFIGRQKKWYVPSDRLSGVMTGTKPDLQGMIHFDINSIKPGSSGAPLIVEGGIVGMVIKDVVDEAMGLSIDLVRRFVSEQNPYPWNLIKCGTIPPKQPPIPISTKPNIPAYDKLTKMVQYLLYLNETKNLKEILYYYADQADYYDRGLLDKEQIEKDYKYYFNNWDSIITQIDGNVNITAGNKPNENVIVYIVAYANQNSTKRVSGRVENTLRVELIDNEFKITSIKAKTLSREYNR